MSSVTYAQTLSNFLICHAISDELCMRNYDLLRKSGPFNCTYAHSAFGIKKDYWNQKTNYLISNYIYHMFLLYIEKHKVVIKSLK